MTSGAILCALAVAVSGQLPGPWAGKPSVPAPAAVQPAAYLSAASAVAMPVTQAPASPTPAAAPVEAAAPSVPPADDSKRFAELLQRIDKLEKQVAESAKSAGKKDEKKDDGAWVDISTEKWNVKMGGHVQMDYVLWADASPSIVGDDNYFEFRRLRMTADGTGYGIYDFRLMFTMEPETVGETPGVISPDIKDAYFSVNEVPYFGRARIGHFFVPFGLEQVTNDTNSVFLERSIPTQGVFTADREVGVAAYNHTDDLNATLSYGCFFDSISEGLKERIDDNLGCRVSGRVTWLPYYDEPSNGRYLVHTGAGILYTDDFDDRIRVRTRPQIHEGPRLIDTGPLLGKQFTNANIELATVMGPLSVQSELYVSHADLNSGAVNYYGSYVYGSFFLTGENRIYERFGQHGAQFGRVQPFNNSYWVRNAVSLGAWELKGRWSYLDVQQVDRGMYNDFTFGFNWYWSDRTRIMFDWIHPLTTSQTVFGETTSDIIGMRFDWGY